MNDCWNGKLIGTYYDTHPHWVVDHGRYAVTLRCRGALPKAVQERLREIGATLRSIKPASEEAQAWHRRQFAVLENALDRADGFCPFTAPIAAHAMIQFLKTYADEGLSFDHWVIMPNHLHLITLPFTCSRIDAFRSAWRRFKSLSARAMNQAIRREGPFWQSSQYDRWIRNPVEFERWQNYLARNPVKAGLCKKSKDYPYLK